MYHYIVNPNAGDRSFESIKDKLKAKLRQLDIDGKFDHTLDADDAAKVTHTALGQGAQTVVVIGGDKTVNEVITAINRSGKSSTSVGIIPTGHSNILAKSIGIRDWQHACELLAARRLRSFRLMDINDYSFIHGCSIKSEEAHETSLDALLEIDGTYRVRASIAECHISNARLQNPHAPNELVMRLFSQINTPGALERILGRKSEPASLSQLHAQVASIELPKDVAAIVDGRTIRDRYFRIRLSQKPVHIISARYEEDRF